MERKIIYVAFDDTEFESERECLNYENRITIQNFGNHLRLWDENMKPIDPTTEDAMQDAYYIYADTLEVREWVEKELEIYCELGWDTVFVGYRNDNWIDLMKEFEALGKILSDMVM